ncbi:MAG TPA: ATP-binding protein [Candidatus Paceibacterota bacterium]|nr:ATP-binding protein [Candidatus Paceibacterota bacterium]
MKRSIPLRGWVFAITVVAVGAIGFHLVIPWAPAGSVFREARFATIVDAAAAAIILILGGWLMYAVNADMRSLRRGIEKMSTGDFGDMMPVAGSAEAQALARAFNALSNRYRGMYRGIELERMRLAIIVNSMPDGVLLMDRNDKIIFMNKFIQEAFKPKGDQGGLATIGTLFPGLNREQVMFHMQSSTSYTFEGRLGEQYFSLTFRAIAGRGPELEGIILWIRDITNERLLEQSKDEFLSIASHEMRTPLTIIRGNAELILDTVHSEHDLSKMRDTVQQMSTSIHESSIRLLEIVNGFLDSIRLERKIDLKPESAKIENIIENIVKDIKPSFEKKNLTITVKKPAQELPTVFVDVGALRQALMNIIGNALHYTEKGGVTITIEAEKEMAKIYIRDTGMGIDTEAQKTLFQKFQTSAKSFGRMTEYGSGLGLYVSKLLMQAMHGDIALQESAPGIGSTFVFMVPFNRPSA